VTVSGKSGEKRVVLLPPAIWCELLRFGQGPGLDTGVPLPPRRWLPAPTTVERIVRKAAQRAD
jgi:hypothetical protein